MNLILETDQSRNGAALSKFSCFSISNSDQGGAIAGILQAALQAVEPGEAVRQHLLRNNDVLTIAGRCYELNRFRRVRLVSVGKAAEPMARATAQILGDDLESGIVLTKQGHLSSNANHARITWLEASHPIPDQTSLNGAQRLVQFLTGSRPDDLVIVLISGGGSALMIDPAPGISLEDLQMLTAQLLAAGANIQQINTLRKHLDLIKGGGLAQRAAPAELVTLILSDVVGDPFDVIASGPTVPDPSTFGDALAVLQQFDLLSSAPPAIQEHLRRGERGEIAETPKPGSEIFANVYNILVGSNFQAAQAALNKAEESGFHSLLLTTFFEGEARQAGRVLGSLLQQIAATGQPLARPACLIVGGETTVTLQPAPLGDNLGGRNQELALASVEALAGIQDVLLITLATDGGDGPTKAAGAVATGDTLARAHQSGLNPKGFLARHDSYHFFSALGDLIVTGPTQTNVNDLIFLFAL